MKNFEFVIEFMGKEVYCGQWEAESLEEAEEDIKENMDITVLERKE